MKKEHTMENEMDKIFKYQSELAFQIERQKSKLYENILDLKKKEDTEKSNCKCKSKFCRINHTKYSWTAAKSNEYLNKLKNLTSDKESYKDISVIAENCDEYDTTFHEKDCQKLHNENEHLKELKCQQCGNRFTDDENLKVHIQTNHEQEDHVESPLECTFFNPSIRISTEGEVGEV